MLQACRQRATHRHGLRTCLAASSQLDCKSKLECGCTAMCALELLTQQMQCRLPAKAHGAQGYCNAGSASSNSGTSLHSVGTAPYPQCAQAALPLSGSA